MLGLRHVPEKEDKMRREDASVLALHKLQDRMYIYSGGEEKESPKRVGVIQPLWMLE